MAEQAGAQAESPEAAPDPMVVGHASRARGDTADALAHFLRAAEARPGAALPLLSAAQELRRLARLDEAERTLREALLRNGERPRVFLELGHLARQQGRPAEALEHFLAARALQPGNAWAHLYAGQALRLAGRAEEAEEALRLATGQGGPAALHAWLELGQMARQQGRDEAALAHFAEAASLAPEDARPLVQQAELLRQLGRAEEAAALLRRVLEREPRNLAAARGLGHAARAAGDVAGAEAAFRRAAAIDPASPWPWLDLAALLREQGDVDEAAEAIGQVLDRDPQHEQAAVLLAQMRQQAGDHETALAGLRELERPGPWPLVEMAKCERQLGRLEAAHALLDRALERDPRHAGALQQRGETLRLENRAAAALAVFRAAAQAHPRNPWPRIGASQALADQGEVEAALRELDAAAESVPPGEAGVVAARRIELMRSAGLWLEALSEARDASGRWSHLPALWEQRFRVEILVGEAEGVETCLRRMPATRPEDRARLAWMSAKWAEAQWRLKEAAAGYEEALRLAPQAGAWRHLDAARMRLLLMDVAAMRRHMARFVRLERAPRVGPRRPRRIPHTHLGQLLNEFELDAEALAALEAIRGLPPAERAEGAMAALRRFPGSTAAAIALMVALREAGRLDGRGGAAGPSPIPRRIAQFWDAKEPPADLRPMMASWAAQNPDHEILLFDDEAARGFLSGHFGAEVLEAYGRATGPTEKSDLFRLAWLYASGGWYADCDDRCHAPLATIAPPGATFVAHQEELGSLCNNLVGAAPQHEVIGRALRDAVAADRTGDSDYLWLATGPGCLTRAAAETLADPLLSPGTRLSAMAVLRQRELFQAVAVHCGASYKAAGRHWLQLAFGQGGA